VSAASDPVAFTPVEILPVDQANDILPSEQVADR
jgi:hypothetical protein